MSNAEFSHIGTAEEYSPAVLKDFSGCFATGVCVITAINGLGKRCGITVNAIASLSLKPPLYVVCLDSTSKTLNAVLETRRFGINILHREQSDICYMFASKDDDKFTNVPLREDYTLVPLINGALATATCCVEQIHPGGDHRIVVGRVESCTTYGGEPLLYYRSTLFEKKAFST